MCRVGVRVRRCSRPTETLKGPVVDMLSPFKVSIQRRNLRTKESIIWIRTRPPGVREVSAFRDPQNALALPAHSRHRGFPAQTHSILQFSIAPLTGAIRSSAGGEHHVWSTTPWASILHTRFFVVNVVGALIRPAMERAIGTTALTVFGAAMWIVGWATGALRAAPPWHRWPCGAATVNGCCYTAVNAVRPFGPTASHRMMICPPCFHWR